jgi:small subunit ribosomal protein S18
LVDEDRGRLPRPAPRSQREDDDDIEEGQDRRRGPGGRRDRFQRRPRKCPFCADRNSRIDYKDGSEMRLYLTDHGKIRPRRQTALCARHQREMAVAIKRARHLALLPFVLGTKGHR